MNGEFNEKYKIDIALFDATGSTTEQISRYYDMKGFRSIDFVIAGKVPPDKSESTVTQKITCRLLSASNSTGGGASGISSATAIIGKISTGVVIGSTDKANELLLTFSTIDIGAVGATLSILGQQFVSATGNTAAYYFAGGASAASTVASEGFITAFNNTNNTLSSVWEAAAHVNDTGATVGVVHIYPKDQNNATYITATGSTIFNFGIAKCCGHLGLDAQHLEDTRRYVAIGVKSSAHEQPVCVTVLREYDNAPASQKTVQVSKRMSGSTSK